MTHSTQNLHLVLLDLHAAAATIAPLASLELLVDLPNVHGHARRQTLNNRDQRATM